MRAYRIALFGHRDLCEHQKVERRLSTVLEELIKSKSYVQFYIGRNGEFDIFTASLIKRVQKVCGNDNNEIILVLPYKYKNIEYYEKYYDSIIIPIEKTHPKGAIRERNQWMIEACDLLICYVEHEFGGAYAALQLAKRLGKDIINLATGDGC